MRVTRNHRKETMLFVNKCPPPPSIEFPENSSKPV
jgi:hypothetical protein